MAASQRFDPRELIAALERHRVEYVLVGTLARVLQGTDETSNTLELVPYTRTTNLERLQAALDELAAKARDRKAGTVVARINQGEQTIAYTTKAGRITVLPRPVGTQGFEDLRRRATREPIGAGLRPQVAAATDLARMLAAQGRPQDRAHLEELRRLMELQAELGLGR